jgi:hypothetical protein
MPMNKQAEPTLEFTALEQEGVGLLNNPDATASECYEMVSRFEGGAATCKQIAADFEANAIDPTRTPDIKAARATMDDARLQARRFENLLVQLRDAAEKHRGEEEVFRWHDECDHIAAGAAADAAQFAEFSGLIARLVAIVEKNEAREQQINELNSRCPSGISRRLRTPELIARNLSLGTPSILAELKLVDFDGRVVWPPQQRIDPALFAPAPYDPRYSPEWWQVAEEAQRQREQAEAKQLERERRGRAEFYGQVPPAAPAE